MRAHSKSPATQETETELAQIREQSQGLPAPVFPHESEADFEVLQRDLTQELAGPRLGFGRQIAFEAAISRWYITRYRQALVACARLELAPSRPFIPPSRADLEKGARARQKEWEETGTIKMRPRTPTPPRIVHLQRELDPLLDNEARRYEEEVGLLYDMRYAERRLSVMEQNVIDLGSTDKKGGAAHSRAKRRPKMPQSDYVDDKNRLTKQARIITGEAPLITGESMVEYQSTLFDVMAFVGNGNASDILAALDVTNDTWQLRRLLQLREKAVQEAFKAKMRATIGDWPESEIEIDPELILAVIFHENWQMLTDYDRLIDRIRHRRKRTIGNAIKRRASRVRTTLATSGMKLIQ